MTIKEIKDLLQESDKRKLRLEIPLESVILESKLLNSLTLQEYTELRKLELLQDILNELRYMKE